jgi:hypothetical protein
MTNGTVRKMIRTATTFSSSAIQTLSSANRVSIECYSP